MKHLLKLQDMTRNEINEILNLADQLKFEKKNGIAHPRLAGKTLGMVFEKASIRTRISVEAGMYQLGGTALFLSSRDTQTGADEFMEDTARVLSRYLDGVMIRTFDQQGVEELARYSTVPVINGLTDYCHPCQVLADLMTIRERKGGFQGLKLAYIGDGNNVANSLIAGSVIMGMNISLGCPDQHRPDAELLKWAEESGLISCCSDIHEAVRDADVVYTDVWTSMGHEDEADQRRKDFAGYCVDDKLMELAAKDAMVLHCLPAHRGEEITAEILDKHADAIFEQAENSLHAQKAALVKCMS